MAWRRYIGSNWPLLLLLTACVCSMWLMVLPSSFWTDETATDFVVRLASDSSLEAVPQVPASIYYALPRAAGHILGFSEISYRIPSVLLMGIALFFIGRLAERLIGRGAGWFAVFVCLALRNFNYYAADARPYALGIAMATAALFFLVRWLDTAKWTTAFFFILFAALLWRVHLVFWAFYPVFPLYALIRILRGSTQVGSLRAAAVSIVLGAAMFPTALQALDLVRNADAHVIFDVPGIRVFISNIPGYSAAISTAVILAASLLLKWPRSRAMPIESWTLVVVWWLGMPLCLWIYSVLSGTSLFVPRYFCLALPGAAMTATAVAALYVPGERWKQAAVLAGLVALALGANWRTMWPYHAADIWRDGARTERRLVKEDTPVIAVSPFIEAQAPVWKPDYFLPGFLYAPLFTYPLRGRIYPFPYAGSADSQEYAANLLNGTLIARHRFVIFGASVPAIRWIVWFVRRPELKGWTNHVYRDGGIQTAVFEKLP